MDYPLGLKSYFYLYFFLFVFLLIEYNKCGSEDLNFGLQGDELSSLSTKLCSCLLEITKLEPFWHFLGGQESLEINRKES